MVTLSLAFKQTSAGTHSPRLPWGRDTPVPDHTVLLGSVSFKPVLLATVERQRGAHRQKGEKDHILMSTCTSATTVVFSWKYSVGVQISKLMDERMESER